MRGRVLQIAANIGSESLPNWVTIAQSTSHKLSVSNQTSDVTTKDLGKVKEITGRSWELSTENLICNYDHAVESLHAANILTHYVQTGDLLAVRLQYAAASNADATDENEGNNKNVVTIMTGECRITSFECNFPNKENSTYSATLTGYGAYKVGEKSTTATS